MNNILNHPTPAPTTLAPTWSPFAIPRLNITGPSAESVLRGMALEALRTGTEVIMTRSDASHLLGHTTANPIEEPTPSLILTDNTNAAIDHLKTTGAPRLLISCTNDSGLTDDAIRRLPGLRAEVTLTTATPATVH
ncbi:MAG: hypothetical protein ABIS86_14540, partial [Streptosporangiaceae bacterium]